MIDLANFGVREGVLGAVVLISLYLAFTLLRLFFVGSSPRTEAVATAAEPVAEVDDALSGEWPSPLGAESDPQRRASYAGRPAAQGLHQSIPALKGVDQIVAEAAATKKQSRLAFLNRLFRRRGKAEIRLEPDLPAVTRVAVKESAAVEAPPPAPVIDFSRELVRSNLEIEVQRLQREGATLREELARLSEEVVRLKSTRSVSPIYNEAMSLAQRGLEATSIADRCGISMGEAELVAALAKGQPTGQPTAQAAVHAMAQADGKRRKHPNHQNQGEERDELYTERGHRRHG